MAEELEMLKARLTELKPQLMTLEWDMAKSQLNPGKKGYYDNLKKEYQEILAKLGTQKNEDNQ